MPKTGLAGRLDIRGTSAPVAESQNRPMSDRVRSPATTVTRIPFGAGHERLKKEYLRDLQNDPVGNRCTAAKNLSDFESTILHREPCNPVYCQLLRSVKCPLRTSCAHCVNVRHGDRETMVLLRVRLSAVSPVSLGAQTMARECQFPPRSCYRQRQGCLQSTLCDRICALVFATTLSCAFLCSQYLYH